MASMHIGVCVWIENLHREMGADGIYFVPFRLYLLFLLSLFCCLIPTTVVLVIEQYTLFPSQRIAYPVT